jgi:hypothetical protein
MPTPTTEFVSAGFDTLIEGLIELQVNTNFRSRQIEREAKLAELQKLAYELKSAVFGAEPVTVKE